MSENISPSSYSSIKESSNAGHLSKCDNTANRLPYDCVNIILNYLSQLLDKKWKLVIDNQGRIHLRFNMHYSPFLPILSHFQRAMYYSFGRNVTISIRSIPNDVVVQVDALEHCRAVHSDENDNTGCLDAGFCYSYIHPQTNLQEYIYVETRYFIFNQYSTFLKGTLHRIDDAALSYNIIYYSLNDSGVPEFIVQGWSVNWANQDELDAAEGMLDLATDFDPIIDFDQLIEDIDSLP